MNLKTLFHRYRHVLVYLVFGGLTTLVNWAVYVPLTQWLALSAWLGTWIAWCVAVAFAFVTNKPFVFQSHDWSRKVVFPELCKFLSCRVGSGLLEVFLMWLCVDTLGWNNLIMKVITSIIVVIANYVGSRFLVFSKKQS